jgi:large subunit ribosomal protein L29
MIDVETLKGQSVGELIKLAKKLQDELFQAKFQHATQQLKTPHKLREIRRDIARVKTFATLKRKELAGGKPLAPKKPAPAPQVKAAPAPKAEKPAKKAAAKKKEK